MLAFRCSYSQSVQKRIVSGFNAQMTSTQPAHLEPSELGTKDYWENYYHVDLASPPSATASLDGWFSDVDAASKILDFLTDPSLNLDVSSTSFLDLGTGNGELLYLLRDEGDFEGKMLGLDYSPNSIKLARQIASVKGHAPDDGLAFEVWDLMHDERRPEWSQDFDVVLDKGTFDAISLSAETDAGGQRICEGYRAKVEPFVKPGGLFLVTSCNWTETELRSWFEGVGSSLKLLAKIKYPSFTFGGQTGQSITSLCFQRQLTRGE